MIIYKITNRVNGKVYIGQTVRSLNERWQQHCRQKGCCALHNAIQKYGKENFTVEQIDVACDQDELDKKEQHWIAHYNSISPNGYNLQMGGNHHGVSEETRKRMSEAHKGRTFSDEVRKRLCEMRKGCKNPYYGKHHSEETRKRISDAKKGHRHSDETRKRMSEVRKGAASSSARKVQCVDTGEIFDCGKFAVEKYKLHLSNLFACCRGKLKTTGGKRWRYYNESVG